jgi:hypothetical protein
LFVKYNLYQTKCDYPGQLIGYYYPVKQKNHLDKLWQNLEEALEIAVKESGMDRETLIKALELSKPFVLETNHQE